MLSDVKNEKNLTKSEKQLKRRKHFYERESKKSTKCSFPFILHEKIFLRHFFTCGTILENSIITDSPFNYEFGIIKNLE